MKSLFILMLSALPLLAGNDMTNTSAMVMLKVQIKEQEKAIYQLTNGYPHSFVGNADTNNNDRTISMLSNIWWRYDVAMTNLLATSNELRKVTENEYRKRRVQ